MPIPFGICQVHIQRTIQTKLTKKPKSIASKELLELSKDNFIKKLEAWQEKHKDFLNEKYIDDSGKWRYTHTRLRSANYTLKQNLPFLFAFESVENLPKTNNGLEVEFMNLKTRLRVHSGLKLENKMSLFLRF